eukprot:4677385-Amphidinium_carterae.1
MKRAGEEIPHEQRKESRIEDPTREKRVAQEPLVELEARERPLEAPTPEPEILSKVMDTSSLVEESWTNRVKKYYACRGDEAHEYVKELKAFGHAHFDVAEIYSPPRFTKSASGLGLLPGFAVDLTTCKANGEFWDLSRREDQEHLQWLVQHEHPLLLAGGPPCTTFRRLRQLSDYKRDPEQVKKEQAAGVVHLRVAFAAYHEQCRAN